MGVGLAGATARDVVVCQWSGADRTVGVGAVGVIAGVVVLATTCGNVPLQCRRKFRMS
jgi:hypothetical protein